MKTGSQSFNFFLKKPDDVEFDIHRHLFEIQNDIFKSKNKVSM